MAELLKECTENKKFDVRLVEKNVQRGVLTDSEVETFIKKLPDDAAFADTVTEEDLKRQEAE